MKINKETDRQAQVLNFQREVQMQSRKGKKWNNYLKLMAKEEKTVKLKRIAFVWILVIASE